MNDFICKEITTGYFRRWPSLNMPWPCRVLFEQWLLPQLKKNLNYMEPGITLLYLKDLPLGQNLNNHLIYINFPLRSSFLNIIERGNFSPTPKNFAVIRRAGLWCIQFFAEYFLSWKHTFRSPCPLFIIAGRKDKLPKSQRMLNLRESKWC